MGKGAFRSMAMGEGRHEILDITHLLLRNFDFNTAFIFRLSWYFSRQTDIILQWEFFREVIGNFFGIDFS